MKVKNTTIYMGDDARVLRRQAENASKNPKNPKKPGRISLNLPCSQHDSNLVRRQQAQKKALKLVGDTLAGEKEIDSQQDLRRDKVKELKGQLKEVQGYIASQENVPEEELTAEMREERDKALTEYRRQADGLKSEIEAQNLAIRDTKLERLKKSPMLKATKEAEAIKEAAEDEIFGMLIEEARDHIDEKREEQEEQAEKIEEKKEAEEEKLEQAREREDDMEELSEIVQDSGSDDIQKEIDDILEKLKLIDEDLKGASVDAQI